MTDIPRETPPAVEEYSEDIPHDQLPAVRFRDLPEPIKLGAMLGPGVVLAASGIGSGEFVLWPNIGARAGLDFLWAALLGAAFMFFIATEAVRYTLATGETIITGFARLWKGWTIGFVLMALLPNLFPGYATGVALIAEFIFGPLNEIAVTIAMLVIIVAILVLSPVVYTMMEGVQKVMVGLMAAFLVLAVVLITMLDAGVWLDMLGGFAATGSIPQGDVVDLPAFAGAIAFAGAGGTAVLLISNYVRDKNLGMGARIPRIVSPITGKEEAGENIGYMFKPTDENMRRWRGWWSVTNREQLLTFFLFTVLSIFIMSALAYATLGGADVPEGFSFIEAEANVLRDEFGGFMAILFLITGMIALFSTNLAVWDMIGRISADQLKVGFLRESRFWSESKIYAITLVLLLIFSILVLLSGLQAPLVLLVIVSFLSGVTSFVYSVLIVQLNRRTLPKYVRMGTARTIVMSLAVLFYGFFFILTMIQIIADYL